MIVRGDLVKHNWVTNLICSFVDLKGMKIYKDRVFTVKRVEGDLVVYKVGSKEYKAHKFLLKKVN